MTYLHCILVFALVGGCIAPDPVVRRRALGEGLVVTNADILSPVTLSEDLRILSNDARITDIRVRENELVIRHAGTPSISLREGLIVAGIGNEVPFLRRIVSLARSGNTTTLVTTEAHVEEAIPEGEWAFEVVEDELVERVEAPSVDTPEGVGRIESELRFRGVSCNALASGSAEISPSIRLIRRRTVGAEHTNDGEVVSSRREFTVGVEVGARIEASGQAGGRCTFAAIPDEFGTIERWAVVMVGPVPVPLLLRGQLGLEISVDITTSDSGASAKATATYEVSGGYTQTRTEGGQPQFELIPPTSEGEGEFLTTGRNQSGYRVALGAEAQVRVSAGLLRTLFVGMNVSTSVEATLDLLNILAPTDELCTGQWSVEANALAAQLEAYVEVPGLAGDVFHAGTPPLRLGNWSAGGELEIPGCDPSRFADPCNEQSTCGECVETSGCAFCVNGSGGSVAQGCTTAERCVAQGGAAFEGTPDLACQPHATACGAIEDGCECVANENCQYSEQCGCFGRGAHVPAQCQLTVLTAEEVPFCTVSERGVCGEARDCTACSSEEGCGWCLDGDTGRGACLPLEGETCQANDGDLVVAASACFDCTGISTRCECGARNGCAWDLDEEACVGTGTTAAEGARLEESYRDCRAEPCENLDFCTGCADAVGCTWDLNEGECVSDAACTGSGCAEVALVCGDVCSNFNSIEDTDQRVRECLSTVAFGQHCNYVLETGTCTLPMSDAGTLSEVTFHEGGPVISDTCLRHECGECPQGCTWCADPDGEYCISDANLHYCAEEDRNNEDAEVCLVPAETCERHNLIFNRSERMRQCVEDSSCVFTMETAHCANEAGDDSLTNVRGGEVYVIDECYDSLSCGECGIGCEWCGDESGEGYCIASAQTDAACSGEPIESPGACPPPDPCNELGACNACAEVDGCGYCGATGRCVSLSGGSCEEPVTTEPMECSTNRCDLLNSDVSTNGGMCTCAYNEGCVWTSCGCANEGEVPTSCIAIDSDYILDQRCGR